jgi:galactofuranosylgalactofuranosylrhamnosyl-N-acetylglucosaminyl-diphospho-decaprenol beta-1,5/1,6-galactofuranosyltransferase
MTRLVLQRLILRSNVETSRLYWRIDRPGASLRVEPQATLDLDTYFNSFDETVWRRHTRLGALSVELHIGGAAHVQLWRHSRTAGCALLAEAHTGDDEKLTLAVPPPPHPRATGRLCLSITAKTDHVTLWSGAWVTEAGPVPVPVMPVICTYNRDGPLVELVARVAADPDVLEAIAGLVIVNNGLPGLPGRLGVQAMPARLRDKLHIVEQGNVGGAGGFTRGLLEARDRGASHAILMDDDVVIEPESILRTTRLFALARSEFVVGGHMLDLFQPNRLYEAGALMIDHKLAWEPLHKGVDLAGPGALTLFLEPTPTHYGGWWFMGLPLSLLDAHGWPMPCFIRGDDIEFGRRLHDAGVPMLSMPGIGIWHEPFYAKLGGWHIYYEFRNMMVLAARHFPSPAGLLTRSAMKWIIAELLTFRYQRAALLLRAVEDFLGGPAIYDRDPAKVHASLEPIRQAYPAATMPREQVMAEPEPPVGPRNRVSFVFGLARALRSEWRRPDGDRRAIRIQPRDHLWFRVRDADLVVVDEHWEVDQPIYRRSRTQFRKLFLRTLRLGRRMRREMPDAVRAWHDAHATFTTEAAWRAYLALPEPASPAATMRRVGEEAGTRGAGAVEIML